MGLYWAEGIDSVSVNEICRRAKISKPGLYREFGNEDGLMKAALTQYYELALVPLQQLLAADAPFRDTLDALITMASANRASQDGPSGCLYVKMNNNRSHLGDATQHQLDTYKKKMFSAYKAWVKRAKAKGEIGSHIATPIAAVYIDAQLSGALSQQARGEDERTIRAILEMAFSVFD